MSLGGKTPKPVRPGQERVRWPSALPRPPLVVEVPYAKLRDITRHLDPGVAVAFIVNSPPWERTVGALCDESDASASRFGPDRDYSARDCEAVLLFGRLMGCHSYRKARDVMASDRGDTARMLLGLNGPRDGLRLVRPHEKPLLRDGVPSQSTLWRHMRLRVGEKKRRKAYEACLEEFVVYQAVMFEDFRELLRNLVIDGVSQKIRRTCPIVDPDTGEVINGDEVTCPDGGSMISDTAPESKKGHGYNSVNLLTIDQEPVAFHPGRINDHESKAAVEIVEKKLARILDRLPGPRRPGVLTGDGAYAGPKVRRAVRSVGYFDNSQKVSGGDSEKTRRNVERHAQMTYEIDGYPNWTANGFRELSCRCGKGKVFSRFRTVGKQARPSVEGQCQQCGGIHIVAGKWRTAENPRRFVKCMPGEEDRADESFGNPLTYGDARAQELGEDRFGQGESLHGWAKERFHLFVEGTDYVRLDQFAVDVALTYCLTHGLAIIYRKLMRGEHVDVEGWVVEAAQPPPRRAAA